MGAGLLVLALAFGARPARAQTASLDRSFEADLFQPAIGPRNFITVDAPEVTSHKQLSFGLFFDLQRRPYQVSTVSSTGNGATQTLFPISTQFKSDLQLSLGLLNRYQIGVSLPVTWAIRGQGVSPSNGLIDDTQNISTAGIGDLRIEAKGQILTAGSDDQFVLAGLLGGTAPTGKQDAYLGDRSATGRAKVLASLQLGRMRFGGQGGILLRKQSTSLDAVVGNQLLWGGAGSFLVQRGFEVMAEVTGRSGLADFGSRFWDENPIEVDGGLRVYPLGMLGITGGIGAGLGKGIGAPQMRIFLGAVFAPDFRDSDHDGVYDSEDRCPDQPEDRDGFKDNDGCPNPDNDNDGIPDALDKCPNDPEDFDQFEDEDGCPDLDNDHDGIPDLNDACPNSPEDGKGKRPHDGCPSTSEDSDGDGVNDTVDKCPDEPEDRDGFQDDDGCPDPDNDNDGIPDGFDNCPNEPEDMDGFEDEDGCPDPDNDHDGIPDAQDKCPNKPETLNGFQDDDGCPDKGDEIVILQDDKIQVTERLAFSGKKERGELKESSASVVALVALVMKGHPEIKKLTIEVQADVSDEEANRRANAIRDVLVHKGVDISRLVATGKAADGSMRVSFRITEKAAVKPAAPPPPLPPNTIP